MSLPVCEFVIVGAVGQDVERGGTVAAVDGFIFARDFEAGGRGGGLRAVGRRVDHRVSTHHWLRPFQGHGIGRGNSSQLVIPAKVEKETDIFIFLGIF